MSLSLNYAIYFIWIMKGQAAAIGDSLKYTIIFWIIKRKPCKSKNIHIIYSLLIRWTNQIQWKLFFSFVKPLRKIFDFSSFLFSEEDFLKTKIKYNYVTLSFLFIPPIFPMYSSFQIHGLCFFDCFYIYICIYIPKYINITYLSHIMLCLCIGFHDWPLGFKQQ